MSYILDALKKSEQERKQGEIPTLQTVHTDHQQSLKKRVAFHKNLLLTLGIGSLAAIAFLLWQWQEQRVKPNAQQAVAEQSGPVPVPEPVQRQTLKRLEIPPASTANMPAPQTAEKTVEPQHQAIQQTPRQSPDPAVMQSEVIIEPAPFMPEHQALPQPQPAAKALQDSEDTYPLLKDLPVKRQKTIPEISLAGHVYADEPSRRMIMINHKIVREGELVGENLRLLRITWDGVIMRHLDLEFAMKLQ